MLGLPLWAAIPIAVIAAQAALWGLGVRPWLRARMARAAREATIELGGDVIRAGPASFFGLESAGRAQVRGSGHLAVGGDAVVFVLIAPRRTVRIPRERITAVDSPRSHLGRTVGRPLLRIAFIGESGLPDSVAFDVGGGVDIWRGVLGDG